MTRAAAVAHASKAEDGAGEGAPPAGGGGAGRGALGGGDGSPVSSGSGSRWSAKAVAASAPSMAGSPGLGGVALDPVMEAFTGTIGSGGGGEDKKKGEEESGGDRGGERRRRRRRLTEVADLLGGSGVGFAATATATTRHAKAVCTQQRLTLQGLAAVFREGRNRPFWLDRK